MLQILIADDHEVIRRGLRSLLEAQPGWRICGEASNGREAVALAKELRPDIALVDLSMPELNGVEATRQIRSTAPATAVLIFTMHHSDELVEDALAAGAYACLHKDDALSLLVSTVQQIVDGRAPTGAACLHARDCARSSRNRSRAGRARLTPREREIAQLLSAGKTNWCVATMLGISVKTVETHREKILGKLRLESIVELVHYAIRNGLVEP